MIARAVTSMNRMLRQVVSWQPLRSCPRTRGRGRVLRYCEICWCDWVGCQGIVGCVMFWCGGGSVSCGVVGWSVLYWEEGGRRVRSDHCQLIRQSTHQCIWLFSVRFVSYITFHLIKGLSQSLTIFLTALSDPILEIYILNSSQIQSNRVDQVVEMWESENSGPAPLFLLVMLVDGCRRGRDVWRSKFGVGCQLCKAFVNNLTPRCWRCCRSKQM